MIFHGIRNRLRDAPERLDEMSHDARVLEQSLEHVAQVNRFLGGHRVILSVLAPLLQRDANVRILDVGTGSADIPRVVARAARLAGANVEIVATDVHPQMCEIARVRCRTFPEIRVDAADALALPFDAGSFDAVLLSMTLHHFEDDAPATAVREAARVGGLVVINELERARLNYAGARLLSSTLWSMNPLTRHDGPLSVRRAFTVDELAAVARQAGLADIVVSRRWFYRLLLTGRTART
ncbi:MAG: methyltransferase domain-containing protein [Longimicrobiales bacterium]